MIEIDLIKGQDWIDEDYWHDLSMAAALSALKHSDYKFILRLDHIVSISISLSDNDEVCALNKQYRGKDKPTNILSFPMLKRDELANIADSQIPEIMLGDLILAYSICDREAQSKNIELSDHFQHLIIHGILHLLGYDHIEDKDADMMQSIEIGALNDMGIGNPYERG